MAWQQQLQTIKDSITWDAVKDGWSSTWFQGSPGGQTAQPADYMGVLGKVGACAARLPAFNLVQHNLLSEGRLNRALLHLQCSRWPFQLCDMHCTRQSSR